MHEVAQITAWSTQPDKPGPSELIFNEMPIQLDFR